ncbi:hypothetical protein JOD43_001121 [Pullulanibacillus pueri]|uniref:L,D-TPase catalytic domain-containing protein n=1 Tax=Pullulanibacillus pueri TaxID=1437324 RepID=A0A8J2ZVJ2_9BACL|nr:L,D-transpeptidase family protein [Pullulanibacillus pueri]MBM7680955.1 hypothetical protein [Pullulanibacillus pueri]GGH81478.1 hypothetical protein GCM10007096_19440 [Pullulanibacillus pueri]
MRKIYIILSSILFIIVVAFAGLIYYQMTRFNAHVTINGTKVGGLTAEQATKKLKSMVLKNIVYVGQKQILDGKDTKLEITNDSLQDVQDILRKQRTFWPTGKTKDYSFFPTHADQEQSEAMKKNIEKALQSLNKDLAAPQDAKAQLVKGKIIVSKSVPGKQYDVKRLLKAYQKQAFRSVIHLTPVYLQPIKADSSIVKAEKEKLQDLIKRTVDYKVQDKVYTLKASDYVKNATISQDLKYHIETEGIKAKLKAINKAQSTLNKNYTFKTHAGKVISVKGQSYGWAIDEKAESKRLDKAFEKGQKSILAYNVYGVGWNVNGVGYHNPTNHGIGNTYAEVSIKEQRIWIYKDGQLKVTTPVVTGRHDTHEDTPTGVWYIEYKASPSVLKGSEAGNPHYSIKVSYWAPFTLSGDGFHDASWRTNWSSTAYLKQGSGGCVNTPPKVMKSVYDNLTQYEPVVIY